MLREICAYTCRGRAKRTNTEAEGEERRIQSTTRWSHIIITVTKLFVLSFVFLSKVEVASNAVRLIEESVLKRLSVVTKPLTQLFSTSLKGTAVASTNHFEPFSSYLVIDTTKGQDWIILDRIWTYHLLTTSIQYDYEFLSIIKKWNIFAIFPYTGPHSVILQPGIRKTRVSKGSKRWKNGKRSSTSSWPTSRNTKRSVCACAKRRYTRLCSFLLVVCPVRSFLSWSLKSFFFLKLVEQKKVKKSKGLHFWNKSRCLSCCYTAILFIEMFFLIMQ